MEGGRKDFELFFWFGYEKDEGRICKFRVVNL